MLLDVMQMNEVSLPFTYLGAPNFKGAPKAMYFQKILDKICSKFAILKGMLLSMAGRVQLVQSVIQGMMVYTMMVYHWPKKILHKLEMHINNFFWTVDIHKWDAVIVKWKPTCKSLVEKGLGVRSLVASVVFAW